MKKLFSMIVAALVCVSAMAEIQRPKLVVGLVVDQMRWDYLYYYYYQYGEGGLRKLVDEGYSFENTMINYVPTVTAIGHTSIYTGTTPALHGICGNDFYINGKRTYCCGDQTVQSVGSDSKEGQMSPRNNLASGIGDVLKIATDYKAKVIGVALKDRAAILPAGHGADAAYWWDGTVGHFVSSTYYMTELPKWVQATNKQIGVKPGVDIKRSPEGVTKTFQMAIAALENEQMGQDDITDMLAISISSTDVIGHAIGTRGPENYAVYMELDRQLANFFKVLDEKVGKGNYLLFLSADHGAAHNPNVMKEHNIPSGGLEMWNKTKAAEDAVKARFGFDGETKIILGENAGRLYLNHEVIAASGKTLCEVKQAVIEELKKNEELIYVVDFEKALTTTMPKLLRERIANGYNPARSGDIFIVPKAGWENVSDKPDYVGTTHGMWNPYDAHIPFVLFGWHVNHGETSTPTNIVDIAPTICALLHIQMPNSCIGDTKEMK